MVASQVDDPIPTHARFRTHSRHARICRNQDLESFSGAFWIDFVHYGFAPQLSLGWKPPFDPHVPTASPCTESNNNLAFSIELIKTTPLIINCNSVLFE